MWKKFSSCADENEKRPRKNTKDIKPYEYNIEQEQNLLENAVKIHRRTFPAVSSPVLLRGTLGLYPIYIYTYIYIYTSYIYIHHIYIYTSYIHHIYIYIIYIYKANITKLNLTSTNSPNVIIPATVQWCSTSNSPSSWPSNPTWQWKMWIELSI